MIRTGRLKQHTLDDDRESFQGGYLSTMFDEAETCKRQLLVTINADW